MIIQKNPPIDIGIGIHDNFKVYKLSLIFFDFLLNLENKEMLIGLGIPFVYALVFHFQYKNKIAPVTIEIIDREVFDKNY